MGSLINTLFRTILLDDSAFREWRERPNLFPRGILLILIISLLTSVVAFTTNLVNLTKPVDKVIGEVEEGFGMAREVMENMMSGEFFWATDPEFQKGMAAAMDAYDEAMQVNQKMVLEIMQVRSPLPRGIGGFLQAVGMWLSAALASIAGWMVYGVMVLIAVNLLGGGAKLPDFLGMVSLYVVPTLLGLLGALAGALTSIPYLGWLMGILAFLFGLASWVWAIVVYVKAVSVVSNLDGGRAVVAVCAPPVVLFVLAMVVAVGWAAWIAFLVGIF